MTEPRFFRARAPVTVTEIAAQLAVDAPAQFGDRLIGGVADLAGAEANDAAFCADRKHAGALQETRAGLCLVPASLAALAPPDVAVLVVPDPTRAFATLAGWFYPEALRPTSDFGTVGVSPAAHVHPSARLEGEITVDPGAVIGPDASIGARTLVRANAVVGAGVQIGRDCVIGANATVTHAYLGDRVVLHSGVQIGQDGFGYVAGRGGHTKLPQLGRVIIQNDVEIGSGSTVDRGALRDTVIGEGTKLDNLVQIAHNVVIGRHCVIAGLVGISGSCTIGDFVAIGGNAGIADHRNIASGAQIAAKAGIMHDLGPGRWVGVPAVPEREFFRTVAIMRRLARRKGPNEDKSNG